MSDAVLGELTGQGYIRVATPHQPPSIVCSHSGMKPKSLLEYPALIVLVAAAFANTGYLSASNAQGSTHTQISAGCLDDVRTSASLAATDVGLGPVPGDTEIKQAARECVSVEEFEAALAEFPAAMGVTSADHQDPAYEVNSVCGTIPDTETASLCVDAHASGLDQ